MLDWVCDNKALVIGGGVLVGTLLGVVVAGAAIAAASSARRLRPAASRYKPKRTSNTVTAVIQTELGS